VAHSGRAREVSERLPGLAPARSVRAMRIGSIRSIHRYPVKSMGGQSMPEVRVDPLGIVGDRLYALRDERAREIRGAKKWPVLMQCDARFDTEPGEGAIPSVTLTLPDGSSVSSLAPECDARLSALTGTAVRLCALEPATNKAHYRRAQPGVRFAGLLARSTTLRGVLNTLVQHGPGAAALRRDFGRESGEPMPDLTLFPPEVIEYTSPPGTYYDAFPLHFLTTAALAHMAARRPEASWDVRRFRPSFVVETLPELTGAIELDWAGRKLRVGEVELACTVPTPRCSMVMQAQPGVSKDPRVLRAIVEDSAQNMGMYASVTRPGVLREGDAVELLPE
jgi:uncharacterized protein YcbX